MSEERQYTIKVVVGDETVSLPTTQADEEGFRKAAHSANEMWLRFRTAQPSKSPQNALAKVAMAFAGLSYTKAEQLKNCADALDRFEQQLDDILLKMED